MMRQDTKVTMTTLRLLGVILAMASTAAAAAAAAFAAPATTPYRETYRPQFHFSPAKGWMNDPNGLVFFDGEYHLFFQHNAESLKQTPVMSWGHAVSEDLVHWKQLPIALSPDDHDGWIWSGSAVVDWHNTSGFGGNDPNHPPLVAMYTAAKEPKFAQAIASSVDRGRTWTKFAGNPVLPHIAAGNRDPRLIWHEPTKRWVMVLFKDVDDTFSFFASPDLKQWTHLHDLRVPGCGECPDFFPLPLDGDASKTNWVFTAANGKYVVGDFDGQHFTPDQDVPRQVDFGRNYYAVQTWADLPAADGRRLQIAWMRGGEYPGMPFNQQMSFPAELTLRTTPDGPRLFRNPAREIERLRAGTHSWNDEALKPGENTPLAGPKGELMEIHADIELNDAAEVGLIVRGERITYNVAAKRLTALGEAPLSPPTDGRLRLVLLVDRTSIETFADDGRVSLTSCFLPKPDQTGVALFAKGGTPRVRSLVVYDLKSAWE
jgi:sucrose-6-phosphate hydrolase SacC (GH32 family)